MRWATLLLVMVLAWPTPVHAQDIACVQPLEVPPPERGENPHHRLARGEGVRVAVIDTGVAPHPELGTVEPVADLVSPWAADPLLDCDGHGTAVAGVIHDIAPGAQILSIRQSSAHYRDSPGGTLETLTQAIHLALDAGARVINISVVSCLDPAVLLDAAPLHDALHRAEEEGVVVIAAAGNTGGSCQPGMTVYPAAEDTVLSVAAVHPGDPHALADYTLAPGEVSAPGLLPVGLSPRGHGFATGTRHPQGQESRFEGTSFAAPVVSGVAALLIERHPAASAADIRHHLRQAAEPGHGVIDPLTVTTHLPGDFAVAGREVGVDKHLAPTTLTGRRAQTVLLGAAVLTLIIGTARAGRRRG
ncbi:S8 family serine peptidase [Corynebacterium sp.]|uniref:S8 family serine peptidase n=1 Tax=Corynebacterium sp. TaxID=1720 RepID=UPI0026E02D52|nr:S8 family serine peptidase [Corynebacterium sp.]MDO5512749.1 S8 family serine peptidase [Corynebacterium sp.]